MAGEIGGAGPSVRRRARRRTFCSAIELLISEPDVAELDAVGAVARLRMGGADDLRRGVEQLEDALAGGHGGLQDVVLVAQILNGPPEALRVLLNMASTPMVTEPESTPKPPRQMTSAMATAESSSTAG